MSFGYTSTLALAKGCLKIPCFGCTDRRCLFNHCFQMFPIFIFTCDPPFSFSYIFNMLKCKPWSLLAQPPVDPSNCRQCRQSQVNILNGATWIFQLAGLGAITSLGYFQTWTIIRGCSTKRFGVHTIGTPKSGSQSGIGWGFFNKMLLNQPI